MRSRIHGEVSWDEGRPTAASIADFKRRNAGAMERLVAFAAEMWDLGVALATCALFVLFGAFIGLIVDHRGSGVLMGAGVAVMTLWLIGAWCSSEDRL